MGGIQAVGKIGSVHGGANSPVQYIYRLCARYDAMGVGLYRGIRIFTGFPGGAINGHCRIYCNYNRVAFNACNVYVGDFCAVHSKCNEVVMKKRKVLTWAEFNERREHWRNWFENKVNELLARKRPKPTNKKDDGGRA